MARSVPGQYRRARLSRSFVSAAPIDAGERAGIPRGGPPAALSFIARTPDTRSSSSVCIGVSFRSASAIGAPLLSRDARRPAPRAPGVESRAASAVRSRPGIALDSDGRSIAEKEARRPADADGRQLVSAGRRDRYAALAFPLTPVTEREKRRPCARARQRDSCGSIPLLPVSSRSLFKVRRSGAGFPLMSGALFAGAP